MQTVFIARAAADQPFAADLAAFLERGCNLTCSSAGDPAAALLDQAEEGLASDYLVLLLSPSSWPGRLPRDRWESLLFEQTRTQRVELFNVLLQDCPFPPLLRRRNFIDATGGRLAALRLLKRSLWHAQQSATQALNPAFSADLEDLYQALADQPGTLRATGAEASRFAKEAGQEFEAVVWVPCHRRTLAQAVGHLGAELGLNLDGPVEQNCSRIQELLFSRRCLLVLDAPGNETAAELILAGRSSTLVTSDAVSVIETPRTLAYARKLIAGRRHAEAYELLYALLDSDISSSDCAHELSWICEHWNRPQESESLRFHYRLPPTEQLSLF